MKKSLFTYSFPLFLLLGTVSDAAVPLHMSTTIDFRSVAKEGVPAVVSIRAGGNPLLGLTTDSFLNDQRFEAFGDPFWGQFFDFPFPKNKMPQARQPQTMAQASGFIISEDGYILTNSHVVKDASDIIVTLLNGNEYPAKIVGQDPNTDVALIKIDQNDLPYLTLGNSDHLDVGEWVVAIGNPLGLQATVTAGIVSAVGRSNLDLTKVEDFIQTDAAVNQGNSGGPLLDLTGEVVGINTAIVTNKGGGGYIGIGFAIPSNIVSNILGQLKTKGSVTRGFLGVSLQKIDLDLASAFGLKKAEGALVADIAKDSPAEKSGIRQGDIITTYNSANVKDHGALRNMVALTAPGQEAKVEVLREGKPLTLSVQLGSLPGEKVTPAAPPIESAIGVALNKLGVTVSNLPIGSTLSEGVMVTQIDSNSPAAWVGLRKGAVIVTVNQKKVSSPQEFENAVDGTKENKPLLLLVKQGDTVRYISLKLH